MRCRTDLFDVLNLSPDEFRVDYTNADRWQYEFIIHIRYVNTIKLSVKMYKKVFQCTGKCLQIIPNHDALSEIVTSLILH
jgi:hypothetical protein